MSVVLSARMKDHETPDEQLALRIQRQLASDSRAVSRLQVLVEDGVVTLRGMATSFYQKQLWLHGAKRVVGDMTTIHDEITVTANLDTSDLGWRD